MERRSRQKSASISNRNHWTSTTLHQFTSESMKDFSTAIDYTSGSNGFGWCLVFCNNLKVAITTRDLAVIGPGGNGEVETGLYIN